MINELSVSGLGGLEPTTIALSSGLTVITGETGTGKTMLLRALSLAFGAKGDVSWLSDPAVAAQVDCVIDVSRLSDARSQLLEIGAHLDDDQLIVTRSLGGRSRASVGGRPVPLGTLSTLFDEAVTIQGQHEQRELARPARQRALVDHHAGNAHLSTVADISATYERLRAAHHRAVVLREEVGAHTARFEQAIGLLADCEQVDPQPGEMQAVKEEIAGLAVTVSHRDALSGALAALEGEPDSPGGLALVASAIREIARVSSEHAPTVAAVQSLTQAHAEMTDVARLVAGMLEVDEGHEIRLERLLQRQRELTALVKRHGCADLDELFARAAQARKLTDEGSVADELNALQQAIEVDERHFEMQSRRALEARERAAQRLAQAVNAQLNALGLAHMTFGIRVARDSAHRLGMDAITFELGTADGARTIDLGRGASGGEMSRVSLAMESVMCASNPVACVVFDEVDAGVGGVTAHAVGLALAELARHTQVILVTHLPQVAAFADSHVVVERTAGAVRARNLPVAQRAPEIARMLGEHAGQGRAFALAEELLEVAQRVVTERSARQL